MKHKKILLLGAILLATFWGFVYAYTQLSNQEESLQNTSETTPVSDHDESVPHTHSEIDFMEGALVAEDEVDCMLSDGSSAECLELTIAGIPASYDIGPFCPATTSTSADNAGIWLDGENVYDADGEFILSLADIYNDSNWKLYDDDGTVRITNTQEAFEAAARPDVDPEYQNYCVEGSIDWLENGEPVQSTVTIPHDPKFAGTASQVNGKIGVTLSGVIIDPSAPVDAILGAYTIAAFDDCGGHINPVEGYHIHAATGCSEVGEVTDDETRAFAVAMDGFYIHSPYENDQEPDDLDECNGHTTEELGYHYHANSAESNGVLTCFMGLTTEGQSSVNGAGLPPRR